MAAALQASRSTGLPALHCPTIYTHAHAHACLHTWTHTCAHKDAYKHTGTQTCTCTHTLAHTGTCRHMDMYMDTHACVCTHSCAHRHARATLRPGPLKHRLSWISPVSPPLHQHPGSQFLSILLSPRINPWTSVSQGDVLESLCQNHLGSSDWKRIKRNSNEMQCVLGRILGQKKNIKRGNANRVCSSAIGIVAMLIPEFHHWMTGEMVTVGGAG